MRLLVVTPENVSNESRWCRRTRFDRAGEGGNYYMCPEFWCPVSEVPMTQQQVQENGGVCTSGEQPLDLTSASFWSQGSKRSPGLLADREAPSWIVCSMLFQKHEKI
jgi:hypothetical protein